MNKVVLITGASTGLGRTAAETLAQRRYRVFAAMRDNKALKSRNETIFLETHKGPNKMKPPSLLAWYRILRARHHLTIFQAVHYAIWLAR